MKLVRLILAALLLAIAAIFAINNRQPVTVDLWPFPFEVEIRLVVLLILVLGLGALIGALAMWLRRLGRGRSNPRPAPRPAAPDPSERGGVPATVEPRRGAPTDKAG